MRRIFVLSICIFFSFLSGGCHDRIGPARDVEVFVDGNGRFPEFLVGTWRENERGLEIVFEPDGKISSAVISLGRVRMRPGETTATQMVLGGKGIFRPGKWTVQYSQAKRELGVNIVVDHFRVELGDSLVQGKTREFFIGQVDSDGRLWWADRYKFPEYVVDTKKYPHYKLPFDPNDSPSESLTFQKVVESK
ncbi:MAG: hypothetical protein JW837_12545 [Sedimentisphaerales bacterium]|nr:hypothetical protein [Sedimentisphaerales bacterium]